MLTREEKYLLSLACDEEQRNPEVGFLHKGMPQETTQLLINYLLCIEEGISTILLYTIKNDIIPFWHDYFSEGKTRSIQSGGGLSEFINQIETSY